MSVEKRKFKGLRGVEVGDCDSWNYTLPIGLWTETLSGRDSMVELTLNNHELAMLIEKLVVARRFMKEAMVRSIAELDHATVDPKGGGA